MAVHVDVTADVVSVQLDSWDRIWALRGHVDIPTSTITEARVGDVRELRRELGWRLGGTGLPGYCIAGNFSWRPKRPGERQFWSTNRDREALVIDTDQARWRRVVVQHPRRHELARRINDLVAD